MSSDDFVAEIGIDPEGRLYIRPYESSFEFIYREAMEVHWDADTRRLISPKPRQWTYVDWFRQIISAAGRNFHMFG